MIQRELMSFFNIDEECSHIILFEWLYLNGMRKILSRWDCHENLWGREMRHPINWEVTNNDVMNQTLYGDWCNQIADNPSSRTYEPERHNRPMLFFDPATDNISMSSVSHRYFD